MKPDKALELVKRYAALTQKIKLCTKEIGESLEKCKGVKGDRLNVDASGWPTYTPDVDAKGKDKGLHIWAWYQPEVYESGYCSPDIRWPEVGSEKVQECPHCYLAHIAVQERKLAKKQLAYVKGAMTKSLGKVK